MTEKEQCKAKVSPRERFGSFHRHQCTKPVWKDGYCRIHHPDSVNERLAKSNARYEERRRMSPSFILSRIIEILKEEPDETNIKSVNHVLAYRQGHDDLKKRILGAIKG